MKDLFELLLVILWIMAGLGIASCLGLILVDLADNYQNPITIFKVTKEISILTEQKECEAKGGEFEIIDGSFLVRLYVPGEEQFDYKLECKKPVVTSGGETIFSEEIKLKDNIPASETTISEFGPASNRTIDLSGETKSNLK